MFFFDVLLKIGFAYKSMGLMYVLYKYTLVFIGSGL